MKILFKLILVNYILLTSSVIFLITVFPVSIIALPFNRANKLRIVNLGWKYFGYFSLKISFFASIYIEDDRPKELQKRRIHDGLFVGNHQSLLDIPLFVQFLRIPPIMKKEIMYYPIFGLCAYASGAIMVDRSKKSSRKKVLEIAIHLLTKEVKAIQYYPEGTRQKAGLPPKSRDQIKTTLIEIAYDRNIPVYAFSFYGTSKALGSSIKSIKLGQKLGVKFRDKLEPKDFESKEDFICAVWKQVQDGYKILEGKLN